MHKFLQRKNTSQVKCSHLLSLYSMWDFVGMNIIEILGSNMKKKRYTQFFLCKYEGKKKLCEFVRKSFTLISFSLTFPFIFCFHIWYLIGFHSWNYFRFHNFIAYIGTVTMRKIRWKRVEKIYSNQISQ